MIKNGFKYIKLDTFFFKKYSKIMTAFLNSSKSRKTNVMSSLNVENFLRCCAKPRKQKLMLSVEYLS